MTESSAFQPFIIAGECDERTRPGDLFLVRVTDTSGPVTMTPEGQIIYYSFQGKVVDEPTLTVMTEHQGLLASAMRKILLAESNGWDSAYLDFYPDGIRIDSYVSGLTEDEIQACKREIWDD